MRSQVLSALKITGLSSGEIDNLIETPKEQAHGDFAFPCFVLAKSWKKSPVEIAKEVALKLRSAKGFEKIEAVGPYVNFFVDTKYLTNEVLDKIKKEKNNYGSTNSGKNNKIVIEFGSPNTNKPLHLGHVRNLSIGDSVARILKFNKNNVSKVSINNDRGVHICKSIIAYEEFGKGKTPEKEGKKSDHFVGDYYVMFNNKVKEDPSYETKAQECLQKWEMHDKKTLELWKKMNTWAFEGFNTTYKRLGIVFDKEYYESKIYKKGKEIVDFGLKNGIFAKKDGAVVIDLNKEGLGEKVLLRADGTSIYITQDLYLAKLRNEEYHMDGGIYVVANEQEYHFKVLFTILKKLGFSFADKLYHLSYGMVELPEGRMKSREGTVVDADNLISEMQSLSKEEITKRVKLNQKDLENRSLAIALSALKYSLLKVDIKRNIIFNPRESIHFEGDTGPYLLYTYARANSILAKNKLKNRKNKIIPEVSEKEKQLISELGKFPEVVKHAEQDLSPNLIANYTYTLCQTFNEFYHSSQVIGSDEESFRIEIVKAFCQVMKNAMGLLGIPLLEEM